MSSSGAVRSQPAALPRQTLSLALGLSGTPFAVTGIVVALLALVPILWPNDYIISLLTLIFIYSIVTQSWNVTIGFCGIWNFGQLAIIALGGYTTGLLNVKLGLNPWLGMPLGMVGGAVAAVVMVLPSIKLRGIYASMLTFAFAEVVRLLIIADSSGLTGGPFGLTGISGLFDDLSPRSSLRAYYWLTLVLAAAVMLFIHRMMNSPFGMGLVGLRESIRFSIGMGIDRRVLFVAATLISGAIGGLAGALYATFYHTMLPSVMGLAPMGLFVTMVVVGGLGTVRGPIFGTFVVMIVGELLRDTVMWRLVVQGALLLLVLAFFPSGVDGLASRGFRKISDWMAEDKAAATSSVENASPAAGSAEALDPIADGSSRVAVGDAARLDAAGTLRRPGDASTKPEGDDTGVRAEKGKSLWGGFKAWLNADQPSRGGGDPE